MTINCLLNGLIIVSLGTVGFAKTRECPKLRLDCLKKVLTIDPSQCESDASITLQFAEGLGNNYDVSGLIPVDSYFLWAKIREIIAADPNAEIIPEELKEVSPYTITNQQYGELLAVFLDLKNWKASEDCTEWYPLYSKREQAKRSAAVWLRLARQLAHPVWNNKLILFGRDRPSPVSEIFSDTVSPIRFAVQNLLAEHNWIATLGWIKKLDTVIERAETQVLEQQQKITVLERKIVKEGEELSAEIAGQKEKLDTANQQIVSLDSRINSVEESLAGNTIKQDRTEESEVEKELEVIRLKQTELEQRIRIIESGSLVAGEQESRTEEQSNVELSGSNREEESLNDNLLVDSDQLGDQVSEIQDQNSEDGSGQSAVREQETETGGIKKLKKRNVSSGVKSKKKTATKLAENVDDIVQIIKFANQIFDQVTDIAKSLKSNTKEIKENKDDIDENHKWQGSEIAKNWRSSNSSFLKKLAKIIPEDTINICLTISVFSISISVTAVLVLAGVVCKLQRSREFKVESRVQLLPEKTLRRRRDHAWRVTETHDRVRTSRAGRSTIELHPRSERVRWTRVRKSSL